MHLSHSPASDWFTIVSSSNSCTVRAKLNFSASVALQKSPRIVSPWVKLSPLFAYYYMGD